MTEAQNKKMVRAYWFLSNNVGDSLNEFLIRKISGRTVVASADKSDKHFIVCGSILSQANKNSTVWGAGFGWEHHRKSDLYGCEDVVSVRGNLSAERIEMDVRSVGDPALLMPMYYSQWKNINCAVGIIPHWSNIENAIEKYGDHKIISPLLSYQEFIKEITSCEYIFSESLHGLILADAYEINNAWIDLGADVGDKFKYADYYSTTTTPDMTPLPEPDIYSCQIHRYKYSLSNFLKSCPFRYGMG